VRAIAQENKDTPAGNIRMGLTDYLVRVPGEFDRADPMRQIVLAVRNDSVVRLADVAAVADGFAEQQVYPSINRRPGAILMVQKQSGANTVQVARAVRERLEELKRRLPPDVTLVNLMDSSEDIERAVKDLSKTLLLGGLLCMAVVLVFLRRWRATLVVALTLPFSLVTALILTFFLGYTINMMTLFGFIIAIGMVVDNAIVILENITRHREGGERPGEAAIYGASEVAMAVTASTLTTVCIFFPILFVKGITRIIFSQFAIVVAVTLAGSLFSAITLAPMLSATLMGREKATQSRGRLFLLSERVFDGLSAHYGRLLGWALGHRKTVIGLSVALFAGTLLLMPFLGSEFMPEQDQAIVMGTIEQIPQDERIAVFTRCGVTPSAMASGMGQKEGSYVGTLGVKLVPRTERSRTASEIAAALRRRIQTMRGTLRIQKFRLETGDPMGSMIAGGGQPLTVDIIGDDIALTDEIAARIKEIAEQTPGTVDVSVSRVQGKPEIWVAADRAKASTLGLNVSAIGDTVRASFYGRQASKYRIHGDEYDIFVRLREADRGDVTDVLATPLRVAGGRMVRLENVAQTSVHRGPLEIERKDQGRIVRVGANVYKRSLGDAAADIEAGIEEMDIPRGVEVAMAGQTEEMHESFFWLGLALAVGVALVYMVMASQFESLVDPFVVIFSLPFAFTGAVWAIFLGGQHISIVVLLGLLLLVGVVVNNAIVLVDYVNILRARGRSVNDAVQEAGRTRLRPVLMTALTTIVALLPMAFGAGQGSEVWNPLGLTVMGGLLVATVVTLVLVPTVYSIFETSVKRNSNR